MKTRGRLLAISFVVFCLRGQSARGAEDVQPEPQDDKPENVLCHCAGADSPAAAKISHALAAPLKTSGLDFVDEPLENVFRFLQTEYEIPIQLDLPALEDAGLTPDEKVTIEIRGVSLRSGLRLLLKQKQLTYVVRDEVLIITTPEEAESELVTCVYDVRDLLVQLPPGRDGRGGPDCDSLIDAIVSCVAKQTWSEAGGGGAEVRPLPPGLLVISQTQAVHEQVADLLRTIRITLGDSASQLEDRGMSMMGGGRGGYGMGGEGMGGFDGGRGGYNYEGEFSGGRGYGGRGGYGGQGGREGAADELFGGGYGERGAEPTPADTDPFAR